MGPVGLGTKKYCTGEGQQQFSTQSENETRTHRPNELNNLSVQNLPIVSRHTRDVAVEVVSLHEAEGFIPAERIIPLCRCKLASGVKMRNLSPA
jgi:hypothetical protein